MFRRKKVAKITAAIAQQIFQRYHDAGETQSRLAREFGLGVGQIGRICRGEAWNQATGAFDAEVEDRVVGAKPVPEEEWKASLAKTQALLAADEPAKTLNPKLFDNKRAAQYGARVPVDPVSEDERRLEKLMEEANKLKAAEVAAAASLEQLEGGDLPGLNKGE